MTRFYKNEFLSFIYYDPSNNDYIILHWIIDEYEIYLSENGKRKSKWFVISSIFRLKPIGKPVNMSNQIIFIESFFFCIIALNFNKIKNNTDYKHHILVACAWSEYCLNK